MAGSGSIPWWAWLLVTLLGCVIIYFVVYAMCCNSESGEEVKCYLCCKQIGGYNWKNGSHRKSCSDKNVIFINSLPTSDRAPCPKCGKYLRQWPEKLVTPFKCDGGSKCPNSGLLLPNTGDNRFNCFTCNYDLCHDCIKRCRGVTARRRNGWVDLNGGMNVCHPNGPTDSHDDDRAKLLGGGRPRSLYLKAKLGPITQKVNDEEEEEFIREAIMAGGSPPLVTSNLIENPTYFFALSEACRYNDIASPTYSDVIGPPSVVLTSKESPTTTNLPTQINSHLAYLPSQSPKQTLL
ncbi:uncharacterized protein [Lepeophtheirus salmonis]|nr:uncharacterized protein LOC121128553 isoform X2 [Lepeophtheirus salmonis]XP_040580081.1 uncharacterized protein LOC121128553 isoform X2 [Lepeophtheirus salmonis]